MAAPRPRWLRQKFAPAPYAARPGIAGQHCFPLCWVSPLGTGDDLSAAVPGVRREARRNAQLARERCHGAALTLLHAVSVRSLRDQGSRCVGPEQQPICDLLRPDDGGCTENLMYEGGGKDLGSPPAGALDLKRKGRPRRCAYQWH